MQSSLAEAYRCYSAITFFGRDSLFSILEVAIYLYEAEVRTVWWSGDELQLRSCSVT